MPLTLDRDAYLRGLVRDVPDFPKPGIVFKDITPLLGNPRALHTILDAMHVAWVDRRIDTVVAIESRGFIFGAALAARLNAASSRKMGSPNQGPNAASAWSLRMPPSSEWLVTF